MAQRTKKQMENHLVAPRKIYSFGYSVEEGPIKPPRVVDALSLVTRSQELRS